MATKAFEELKQMAIQIRDEKTNKQNTATRIGTQMLEHLNKLEQDYYDKTTLDKRVTELNISVLYPTLGVNGTNKYTLAGAIAQVPSEYRAIQGLKVSFVSENENTESWEYKGGDWNIGNFTEIGARKFLEIDSNTVAKPSSADLQFADELGNVLVQFQNGHFKTKNFDSARQQTETNDSLSSDLEIADEAGNVLVQFQKGHIKTKNFDSSKINISYKPYRRETYFSVGGIIANQPQNTNFTPVDINTNTDYNMVTDYAVLYLPESYKSEGEATKLIIFCKHGGSVISSSQNPIFSLNIFNYMLYLGYAILAVDGVPDELVSALGLDNTRVVGNYMAVQSTKKAYDYVVKNYNIDTNGAYIFGYSQGGHFAQNVVDLSGITFLACAELSPVCSMQYHQWDLAASVNVGGGTWTRAARLNIARLFGFNTVTNNDELLLLEYDADKVCGYDPWTRNVINPYDKFMKNGNLYKLPEDVVIDTIVMQKKLQCPLKIWCADDDNLLGVDVMKVFIKACKNAGQVADICVYNSGGHSIFSNQSSIGTFMENGETKQLYQLAKSIAAWYNTFGGYVLKD